MENIFKKRILISRTDRLGDVVLSTPFVQALRREYPDAYIAFMVKPENAGVLSGNTDIDEIITYDKNKKYKNIFKTLLFAFSLRGKKFDIGIALHPNNRVHLIMFFAGIQDRVGYDRKMDFLLTKKIKHLKQEGKKHEVDYNLDMLEAFGVNIAGADRKPYMKTGKIEKRIVDKIMLDKDIGRNVIALHVGASCRSKRWPAEKFAEVADILKEKYNLDIVLVGGNETHEYSDIVMKKTRQEIINLTGKLSISELAEFLSRCRLLISNDSGPVHVAVACNTPVVDIFGRKEKGLSPERWGPLGYRDIVLYKDVGCNKCLAHNCTINFKCLHDISVYDVVKASESVLSKN